MRLTVVVGAIALISGCGDGLSAGGNDAAPGVHDARAGDARPVDLDAGIEDAAPPDHDATPGGDATPQGACDPVTQQGCAAGEKCSWLVIDDSPSLGRTDCVPDGTVAIGDACTEGPPGETTGHDDCAAGGLCVNDVCHAVCSIEPDTCADGFACSSYTNTFTDDPAENTGVCDDICDPVAQDCGDPTHGCYLQLASGRATCTRVAPGAEDRTQGMSCLGDGFACFLNGCAEGFGAFLFAGAGAPRDCTAFCSPVETYLVDPDGDGTGSLVAGADANGAAPFDCSEARIGVAAHQCRFFQSYFIDMDFDYLDYVSAAYGFCAPRTGDFGNCRQFSQEWFLETYNDFIEGGGTPEQWGDEITALCDATPARCAHGCAEVATLEALDAAYCAVPANMTRPACIDALLGARVVRRSLERHRAEQLVRAGMVAR